MAQRGGAWRVVASATIRGLLLRGRGEQTAVMGADVLLLLFNMRVFAYGRTALGGTSSRRKQTWRRRRS